ncbi:MAG: hypothetical protein MI862_13965 [Desulfobacterales bacterium]|nr:hypothetical protein [Desulfobacterales bacterium]
MQKKKRSRYVKQTIQILIRVIIPVVLFFCIPVFCMPVAGFGTQPPQQAPYREAVRIGTIADGSINEVSGLAASYRDKDLLWMINDSGHPPVLYGVSRSGVKRAVFKIEDAVNTDWEDMSLFRYQGESYLLIADVGDNLAQRQSCTLYIIREPDRLRFQTDRPLPLKIVSRIRFNYENGPRDCEAVAVDIKNKQVLLLSKRESPPALYQLPLKMDEPRTRYTARRIAPLTTIPKPTPSDLKKKYGKYRSQPTSMDLSPDSTTLIILTYKHAYYFKQDRSHAWKEIFKTFPREIKLPHPDSGELRQRETICIHPQTGELIVTSEGRFAPIYSLQPKGL